MTREEAFKGLKENICAMCAYGSQNMDTCDIRGCDNRDYIKTLEQVSFSPMIEIDPYSVIKQVLDKIRTEITAIAINGQVDEHTAFIRTGEQVKQMALDIIDKYKSESEESNANSD